MTVKKKLIITLSVAVLLLCAVLFFPLPAGHYDDGGTRDFRALTYRLVRWNRLLPAENAADGLEVYSAWRFYPMDKAGLSLDQLWEAEVDRNPALQEMFPAPHTFYATVTEVREDSLLVDGFDTNELNYRYEFSLVLGEPTALILGENEITPDQIRVGDPVLVAYTGEIQECYPARIANVRSVTVCRVLPPEGEQSYRAEFVRIDGNGDNAALFSPGEANYWGTLPLRVFTDKKDLQSFLSELLASDTCVNGGIWNQSELFTRFPGDYDDEFFKEKALILIYLSENSSSNTHRIHHCSTANGVCTISVETVAPESGDCAMAGWVAAVAVDKDAVSGCPVQAYRFRN